MDKIIRYIFYTIVLSHFANSEQVDTLSYYEKFNNAVISYKEGRYSLAASKFSNILSNDRSYKDPASQLMMAKSQYHLKLYQKAHRSCKSILNNLGTEMIAVNFKFDIGPAMTRRSVAQSRQLVVRLDKKILQSISFYRSGFLSLLLCELFQSIFEVIAS